MRKRIFILVMLFSCPFMLFAQDTANKGKEIENTVAAVKAANPGDYFRLPSGKKYVLTKAEIEIVKGVFNYEDLSDVKTETLADGTEIKYITPAYTAYKYPDGQSTHILKTSASFTAFMRHIRATYHLSLYIDFAGGIHEYAPIESPEFDVFRASVQFHSLSNGIDETKGLVVTVYNDEGKNYEMRFASISMIWGNVSDKGAFRPTDETHPIEFDIE